MSTKLNLAPHFKAKPVSFKRVGGLTFVKVGRLSLSFCLAKPKPETISASRVSLAMRG